MDASIEEEMCSDGQLLVSINGKNNICGQQKLGSGALSCESIFEMIEVQFTTIFCYWLKILYSCVLVVN